MKALAKEPQQRYASVTQFAEALTEASKVPLPVAIKPPSKESQPNKVAKPLVKEASKAPPLGTLLQTYSGHSRAVQILAWSPDSSCIASGSADNTVQVWQAK